jgi:hypothetical protein
MKRLLRLGLLSAVGVGLLIQLVPYGRDHDNPRVVKEPRWDTATTRALVEDACFTCHSNETEWPWYSNIAPASWLLQRDVDQGREALNFSRFDLRQKEAPEAAETVADGEMPPLRYTLINPEARLARSEKRQLIQGLRATLGSD